MEELNKQHVQVPDMDLSKDNLILSDPYVYACIKRYMNNNTKEAFPSIEVLIQDTKLTRKTVIDSIKRLEAAGYLSIRKTFGKPNVYKFNDYKKFEIFSYDFLDNPDYTPKEKSYLVTVQQDMFKNPETEHGFISYSCTEMADKLNVSLNTLKKIETSLIDKKALMLVPINSRNYVSGINKYERIYSFEEFTNQLAMKFQDIDEKLEEKVDKKEFDLLKKRIEELEKLLKPQVEIVL